MDLGSKHLAYLPEIDTDSEVLWAFEKVVCVQTCKLEQNTQFSNWVTGLACSRAGPALIGVCPSAIITSW